MPKVKLRALDHKGNKVHTRWGHVQFDGKGEAELDVPEDEVPMLQAMRPFSWLASDHGPRKAAEEAAGEPAGEGEKGSEGSGEGGDSAPPSSEQDTPPQGVKKPPPPPPAKGSRR